MKKPEVCPECFSEDIRDCWSRGRKLVYSCGNCFWKDEPRIPDTRMINTTKEIPVGRFGYTYCFELFDKYGHIMIHSKAYNSKEEAEEKIEKELVRGRTDNIAGPYTAILWPNKVLVYGKVFKSIK